MKRMFYRYFRKPEELSRFVNDNKLAKEDILTTFVKDNNVWLYYWK